MFSDGEDPLSNVSAGTGLAATATLRLHSLRTADLYKERSNFCGAESTFGKDDLRRKVKEFYALYSKGEFERISCRQRGAN